MAAIMQGTQSEPEALPAMRRDLEIFPAKGSGVLTWIIADPLRHAHFRISQAMLEILSAWDRKSTNAICDLVRLRHGREISPDDVEAVRQFLETNELLAEAPQGGWRTLAGKALRSQKSLLSRSVHSYLFFRIPLVRPQRFLDLAWPLVSWLFTHGFVTAVVILGIVAAWLTFRQWDVFAGSFSRFLTFEGFAFYGMALVGVKIIHEFGHAFMARKFGVKVPTIGVAFIVLFPILYTDTTAAWREGRRERLMIDAAGIMAELVLAVLATTLWVFLPPGDLRSAAFVVASVSWVMSLAVNLNPLMRFDGYYLLSDGLGVENLQQRGFALARWKLREILFGFGEPQPEQFDPWMKKALIIHAYATWIYRFFLFLGIALVVYHMFFKLLGIALFAVEIVWFIAQPMWREIREWKNRSNIMTVNRQTLRSSAALVALLLLVLVPWQTSVRAPAVFTAGDVTQIFPAETGRLVSIEVSDGEKVKKGRVLFTLDEPLAAFAEARAEQELRLLNVRIQRGVADSEDLSLRPVLQSERATALERKAALDAQAEQRVVRAAHDGTITNLASYLVEGQYYGPADRLALLIAPGAPRVVAYVPADSVQRLQRGATARFYAEEPEQAASDLVVADIALPAPDDPGLLPLMDVHGGPIITRPDPESGATVPAEPHYQVMFEALAGQAAPGHELRGTVHISAEAESLAIRIVRRVAGVIIRESGF